MQKFVGLNGTISASEKSVILSREKKLDGVFHKLGTMEIPIDQIEKVVFSEAGLTNGFIAILRKGDKRPHSVFSAMKNQNAVIFRLTKNAQAQALTEYVRSLI
ncbi:MAG: hypothetical protein IJ899_00205 [Blautia sp.]|nr:hypothetical protein [Blautia sp.]